MPIITLTSDLDTSDGYVGAIKGVIARLAPAATIVDITHSISDVAHAAWVIATSTCEFPDESIHIVVLDPRVDGPPQPAVVARGARPPRGAQIYVGPDNGVFAHLEIDQAWRVENAAALAPQISETFRGRDVFAYVAAQLALGREPSFFGPRATLTGTLPWGKRPPGKGRVVHEHREGEAYIIVTDLPAAQAGEAVVLEHWTDGRSTRTRTRLPVVRPFASGKVFAYVGAAGTIEVAVRDVYAMTVDLGMRIEPAPRDLPSAEGPYR